jgi:hypothetical protein
MTLKFGYQKMGGRFPGADGTDAHSGSYVRDMDFDLRFVQCRRLVEGAARLGCGQDIVTAHADDLGKTLVGALATLHGALWLDSAKDPSSKYWPAGQIKAKMSSTYAAFYKDVQNWKDPDYSHIDLQRAIWKEEADADNSGWSYSAVVARAKVIERYLARPKST